MPVTVPTVTPGGVVGGVVSGGGPPLWMNGPMAFDQELFSVKSQLMDQVMAPRRVG